MAESWQSTPQDTLDMTNDGEMGMDLQISDTKMRQLMQRVEGLESSNARLRRRAENIRADEAAILQQNDLFMQKIDQLQTCMCN